MFQNMDVFRLSQALASHASARQAVITRNIANADTPGYQARDLAAFQDTLSGRGLSGGLRQTRPGHFTQPLTGDGGFQSTTQHATVPNGNSVSLEGELLKAAEVEQDHSRALAVYKSSLSVLRSAFGRR